MFIVKVDGHQARITNMAEINRTMIVCECGQSAVISGDEYEVRLTHVKLRLQSNHRAHVVLVQELLARMEVSSGQISSNRDAVSHLGV